MSRVNLPWIEKYRPNNISSVLSEKVLIKLATAPSIQQISNSKYHAIGEDVVIIVNATGDEPLEYQWSRNNVPVNNGNSSEYIIKNLNSSSIGTYKVTVKNHAGTITSSGINIDLLEKVQLSACPNDAVSDVKVISDYVSHKKGGEGCVRDIIEQVLTIQNNCK